MLRFLRSLRLKWKLAVIFGTVTLISVLAACHLVYNLAAATLDRDLTERLRSVAGMIAEMVDADRLAKVHAIDDPYYKELKPQLMRIQSRLSISWLAIYRHNGKFYTHIADGSEPGDEFVPDHPIFDPAAEIDTAFAGQPASTGAYVDVYGTWRSSFHPVKNAAGAVVAIVDASVNTDDIESFQAVARRGVLKAVLGVAVFVLLTCLILAHALGQPIDRLTESARRIGLGDFSVRVAGPERGDEIGILVRSFNAMTEALAASQSALQRKIFELTALFDVSQKVNHARDSNELLRVTLERALGALDAERGSVMLLSEVNGTLAVEVACGIGVGDGAVQKRIEFAPGEGVAGVVFETMKPVFRAEEVALYFKPYEEPVEATVRSLLCVPLLVEGKAIGVVNVVNKRAGAFDLADANLMTTMAAQVALTIEKARLYELAVTDGLTKLYVHRYFQVALDRELARAKRYHGNLSLLLFDIDHFKRFNDDYGHQIGDIVLATTAGLIKSALRSIDIPARYGGEEFAAILPETDAEAALHVAERIRQAIAAAAYPGHSSPLKVTISVGIATFPTHAAVKNDLIRKTDEALYASKHGGRNRSTLAT